MDPDFYIEENSPVKIIFTISLFLLIIGGGIWAYYYYQQKNLTLNDVTVELGNKLSTDINDYASGSDLSKYTLDVSAVHVDEEGNTDSVGEYSYELTSDSGIKKGKLYVVDTTAPEVTLKDLTVGVNEEFDPDEFIESCSDLSSECSAAYKDDNIDTLLSKAGEYEVTLVISDASNNSVTKTAKLTVSSSTTLETTKENDFTVAVVSPEDEDWNKTYTYKFAACVSEDSDDYQSKISEVSSEDYSVNYDQEITGQSILTIYNTYGYVIGISVKLTFADNSVIYVTN